MVAVGIYACKSLQQVVTQGSQRCVIIGVKEVIRLRLSRVPLPHNGGDPAARHRRSQQMDAWYALTRMSRFVPV